MKNFVLGVVCGTVLGTSTAVFASNVPSSIFPSVLNFHLNGVLKQVDGTDETGVLNYNNQAYIPLRLFSESMGATVDYRSSALTDKTKHQIDVYYEDDRNFTIHDPDGFISLGQIKTDFSSDKSLATGIIKINKTFDEPRIIILNLKSNDGTKYDSVYFAISNPENHPLKAGDIRAFTAILPTISSSDKLIRDYQFSVTTENPNWTSYQFDPSTSGTHGEPLQILFSVDAFTLQNGFFNTGDRIPLNISISNVMTHSVVLSNPLPCR